MRRVRSLRSDVINCGHLISSPGHGQKTRALEEIVDAGVAEVVTAAQPAGPLIAPAAVEPREAGRLDVALALAELRLSHGRRAPSWAVARALLLLILGLNHGLDLEVLHQIFLVLNVAGILHQGRDGILLPRVCCNKLASCFSGAGVAAATVDALVLGAAS